MGSEISGKSRTQYLLGFYAGPSNLDGQIHTLEVRVTIPDTVVRSRRAYRSIRDSRLSGPQQ